MSILAIVPDYPQSEYMESALKEFAPYDSVLVRENAERTEAITPTLSLRVMDKVSDTAFEPWPEWDYIERYVEYELAVSSMRDETCSPPGFDWEEIRRGIGCLKEFLDGASYDGLVVWNDRLWYNEVALEWAREIRIPYVVLERGCYPGTMIVDGVGLDEGHNQFRKIWEEYKIAASDIKSYRHLDKGGTLEHQPDGGLAAWEIVDELPPHKPVVFAPLQVPIDTNVVFRGGGNKELLDFATQDPDIAVIAKRHPKDFWTNEEWLKDYCSDRGVMLIDADIKSILPVCCGVVTQNSQVGIDAIRVYHKVGLIGSAFWKGCEATIDDPATIRDFVDTKPIHNVVIDRFLVALRVYYLVHTRYAGERIKELLSV